MKRFTFIATALIALASCSDSEFVGDQSPDVGQNEQGAISFGSGTSNITRASFNNAESADLLGNNFVVKGIKSDGTIDGTAEKDVFDHYNVNWVINTANTTTSNTANWEYVGQARAGAYVAYGPDGAQAIKYWDYSKKQYDFIAFSAGKGNTAAYGTSTYTAGTNVYITEVTPSTMTSSTGGAYTIKGQAAQLAKVYIADLQTVYRDASVENDAAGDYNKTVTLTFRPLSAKVRIGLYETVPGYSVKDVVFYKDNGSGTIVIDTPTGTETWGNAHLYTTGSDVFNTEGTYTVYFPTTGADKAPGKTGYDTDYNKAHLAFAAEASGTSKDKAFGGKLTGSLAAEELALDENEETEGKHYLGRSSSAAIYAGAKSNNYYTIVLPNETGAVLNLKVDYTLLSTDGSGEEIKVTGATAQVPAVYATWKSGYAYTYLFKISQNTNGWTNPSAGPAGLYPVTFDAVVVNDEVDNTQETITTVATPSITTYAKGTIVTDNDEYNVSNHIYAIVTKDGTNQTLTPGTNAWLYTVTLPSVAAQTINEASVDNALASGKYNSTAKTWTVTDANDKALVVTQADGLTAITSIPAADSPNGNAFDVIGATFTPAAAGTYVIRYQETAPTYDGGTLGSALTAAGVTTLDGYFTLAAGVYTQCNSTTAPTAETTYYKITTPGKYHYKVIKVVAAP